MLNNLERTFKNSCDWSGVGGCEFTVWSEMRFPRMRYSCWILWQWKEVGIVGEGGGPGPLGLLQWLLPWLMVELTQPATDIAMGSMRLRTDTFDSPPPSMGTHPPEESSLVITCARTRTSELFLQYKQNKNHRNNISFSFNTKRRGKEEVFGSFPNLEQQESSDEAILILFQRISPLDLYLLHETPTWEFVLIELV